MSIQPSSVLFGRARAVLEILATVLIIAVCMAMLISLRWPRPAAAPSQENAGGSRARVPPASVPVPAEPVSIATAATKGSEAAKVAIIEYLDFQCPYCGKFAKEILPAIEKEYVATGRVLIAFKNLPLESIHPFALRAALSAECAGKQGRFWEMHDQLFRDQRSLDDAGLRRRAVDLRLNAVDFQKCLGSDLLAKVKGDAAGARALAVAGTPTFFVGTLEADRRVKVLRSLAGAASVETFQTVINELLGSESR